MKDMPQLISESVYEKMSKMVKDIVNEIIEKKLGDMKSKNDKRFSAIKKQLRDLKEQKVNPPPPPVFQDTQAQLDRLEARMQPSTDDDQVPPLPPALDCKKNIVIINLPGSENENVINKTNALLKEGLKLDIKCVHTEHKGSQWKHGNGVIVARFNSQEDKERILQTKKVLGKSRVYSQVTIRPDQSPAQRALDRKLCMVAGAMGMEYRGGRYRYSTQNREEGGQRSNRPDRQHPSKHNTLKQ